MQHSLYMYVRVLKLEQEHIVQIKYTIPYSASHVCEKWEKEGILHPNGIGRGLGIGGQRSFGICNGDSPKLIVNFCIVIEALQIHKRKLWASWKAVKALLNAFV
ncbi:hypothetical protein L3X38_041506 [Prunus dulcis]|uniref:Uncharacterized protein n=1 Tax=Prunus dulcis TaxID=3755 RepID=A0AAD4UTD3_PRUDU|nr:hypothetical protein L3X38_041506 [Prunus dulcis]